MTLMNIYNHFDGTVVKDKVKDNMQIGYKTTSLAFHI